MTEFRTKPLGRSLLLDELAFVCSKFEQVGTSQVAVSFGLHSNLPIDEIWKYARVRVNELSQYVVKAEQDGTVEIGKADVFIKSENFEFTLCHEGDAHVSGASSVVQALVARWRHAGYEPYEVQRPA
jgi:hypothetical protein